MDIAALYSPLIADQFSRIAAALKGLQGRAVPRHEFGLIHGEFGMEHVRVTKSGKVYFLDVDAVQFFDLEWDYCLFDSPPLSCATPEFVSAYSRYPHLEIDPARVSFYRICRFVSWITFFAEAITKQQDEGYPFKEYLRNTERWLMETVASSERA